MRLHRFYVSQPLGEEVVIDDVSKINQWQKVFRYTSNDVVILFNGEGVDAEYSISSLSPKNCTLRRIKIFPSTIPKKKITLYLSLIKKDSFELAVEKCTELGVSTIVPVITERSQDKNLNFTRLRTIAIEAAEQCGRGNVPVILETISLRNAIENIKKETLSFVFQKEALPIREFYSKISGFDSVSVFIGPEGGWTPSEVEAFKEHSFYFASLGETILRAETAAIVASSSIA